MMTRLELLSDRIAVVPDPEVTQEKTDGGILLPQPKVTDPYRATVVLSGVGRITDNGEFIPNILKPGDRILYGKFSFDTITLDGVELYLMHERDVKARIYDGVQRVEFDGDEFFVIPDETVVIPVEELVDVPAVNV